MAVQAARAAEAGGAAAAAVVAPLEGFLLRAGLGGAGQVAAGEAAARERGVRGNLDKPAQLPARRHRPDLAAQAARIREAAVEAVASTEAMAALAPQLLAVPAAAAATDWAWRRPAMADHPFSATRVALAAQEAPVEAAAAEATPQVVGMAVISVAAAVATQQRVLADTAAAVVPPAPVSLGGAVASAVAGVAAR